MARPIPQAKASPVVGGFAGGLVGGAVAGATNTFFSNGSSARFVDYLISTGIGAATGALFGSFAGGVTASTVSVLKAPLWAGNLSGSLIVSPAVLGTDTITNNWMLTCEETVPNE